MFIQKLHCVDLSLITFMDCNYSSVASTVLWDDKCPDQLYEKVVDEIIAAVKEAFDVSTYIFYLYVIL